MGWLEGEVALVTGGGAGIGRAIVDTFVEEGAKVGVLDVSPEALSELEREHGEAVRGVRGDVTRWEDNARAVSDVVDAFGRLDVFVGNAGIADGNASLDELPAEKLGDAFDELFGVNVKGYLLGAKAALPELVKTGGCMIFTGSFSSFNTAGGGVLYITSKHAIVGLVKELAYELAPKVRVNGVAPGVAPTRIAGLKSLEQPKMDPHLPGVEKVIPLGFMPEAADHTWAYVLLASRKRARVITGTFIVTDSGFGIRGIVQPSRGADL